VVEGETARAGRPGWRASYLRQREHKKEQLDEMFRLAEGHGCRMLYLLRHFGDLEDRTRPCGRCDSCAPGDTVVRRWRPPTRREAEGMARVLDALRLRDRQATGQVHRAVLDVVPERRDLERLLGGLVRAGLVQLTPDTFDKDGRTISFQRAALTREGRGAGAAAIGAVPLEDGGGLASTSTAGRRGPLPKPPRRDRTPTRAGHDVEPEGGGAPPELVARIRAWRLEEARRRRIPAFRIFGDRTLFALAESRPGNEGELLAVSGLGPKLVERYGDALLKLVARER
jgi:DNA topoisomerase-3